MVKTKSFIVLFCMLFLPLLSSRGRGGESTDVEESGCPHCHFINNLRWGDLFNGTIDEVKVYGQALSSEQISNNYNLNYKTIVSQETTPGEEYVCSITPNDGYDDGNALNSSSLLVVWKIMFNVTSGEFTGEELNNVNISSCNYTGFSQGGDATNPYGPYGFPPGSWECVFKRSEYYDKTLILTSDNDKTIDVVMQKIGALTDAEHTWLEALYNCIILKDCDLYNLLLQINNTVGNIWEHTKPTDESVVTSETTTNKIVNSTHNLTIDYTVSIPIKAGYSLGAYLPVRIGYWFLNVNNSSCYNQGDRPTGVADPYCQPLVIETIGPMGGSVSFTVNLQPSLPAGDYNIKRIIDIDPDDQWINHGQEEIETITVTEDLNGGADIGLDKTGEKNPLLNENQQQSSSSSSGSGGGGSRVIIIPQESSPITNIYQNITNVIIQQEDKQESEEDISNEEKTVIEEETKPKDRGLGSITGAAIGIFKDLSSKSVLVTVIVALVTIIVGLVGYIYGYKKK